MCVEPDVKVLKWEEGESTGEEAEGGEKSGKQRGSEVRMCGTKGSDNDEEREHPEEV